MTKKLFSNPRKPRNIKKAVIRTLQIRWHRQLKDEVRKTFDGLVKSCDSASKSVREFNGIINQIKSAK